MNVKEAIGIYTKRSSQNKVDGCYETDNYFCFGTGIPPAMIHFGYVNKNTEEVTEISNDEATSEKLIRRYTKEELEKL